MSRPKGNFFSAEKDKDREKERDRRLDLVLAWLRAGGSAPGELVEMRADLRKRIPAFHWMAEYPEVFWVERPDPLDEERTGKKAWIDAFVGNPPFSGKNSIAKKGGGAPLVDWLKALHCQRQKSQWFPSGHRNPSSPPAFLSGLPPSISAPLP